MTVLRPTDCPTWCRMDHAQTAQVEADEKLREHWHSVADLEHVSVDVYLVDDLEQRTRGDAVVWLEGVSAALGPVEALQLAAGLMNAVDVIQGQGRGQQQEVTP
jgi:hypothetical protein